MTLDELAAQEALNNMALGFVRRRNEAALERLTALREEWRNQALDEATPPNLAALLQACAAQLVDLELILRGQ